MTEKYFVDTNILVYAHDRTAGRKHERATELVESLWTAGTGVLSTQVLQELCVNLRRKVNPPLPTQEVRLLLEDYLTWEVFINDSNSVIKALEIEARHRISFWDALILHAAESSGAAALYSEDLAAGHQYGAIQVVSPFITS